jgi:hypothetical protein
MYEALAEKIHFFLDNCTLYLLHRTEQLSFMNRKSHSFFF